tara:strand:+ start:77 stop:2911 length:2835 start_codon:yes stop_codon:yes gene_type:complete
MVLISILSLQPTISYAKEAKSENFFSKLFSKILLEPNNSAKYQIYKSDIDTLNIDTLVDFEFSISDILKNYMDKKNIKKLINNIISKDDKKLDASTLEEFNKLLPKSSSDKLNGKALIRIAKKLGKNEKTTFEIKKKVIFHLAKVFNINLALTEKTLDTVKIEKEDNIDIKEASSSSLSGLIWVAPLAALGGGGGGGGSGGGDSSWPSNPRDYQTTEYNTQYGLGNINAANAYARGYTGSGITVSVLDSPFDTDHPNLQNVFVTGYDASSGGTNVTCTGTCTSSHGTHVAGIIAANKNDSGMHGVAYNAKIKPITIFNSSGVDDTTTSQLVNAINAGAGSSYAAMNNSWGVSQVSQINFGGAIGTKWAWIPSTSTVASSIQTAFDNAAANTVIVFSNGNEGWNSSTGRVYYYNSSTDASNMTNAQGYSSVTVNTPSTYGLLPQTKTSLNGKWLTVVALDSSNNIASYSNGCGSIAKTWCISAPGSSVYSTVDLDDSTESGSYGTKSGTSMAAPHVTGAIAVLKQQFPNLTSTQIVSLLTSTATDLGDAGVDNVYGVGMLNLNAASTPSGVPYISASNANRLQATTNNTYIRTSNVFGNSLSKQNLKVGVLDAYDRAYIWSPIQENPNKMQLSAIMYLSQFDKENPSMAKIGSNSFLTYYKNDKEIIDFNDLKLTYREDNTKQSLIILKNIEDHFLINSYEGSLPKFSHIYSNFENINQYSSEIQITDKIEILSNFATGKTYENNKLREFFVGTKYLTENFIAKLIIGNIIEEDKFLGASFAGAFDLSDQTKSTFISFNSENKIAHNFIFNTSYMKMISKNNFSNSNFAYITDVKSDTMQIGFSSQNIFETGDKISLNFKKPLTVIRGSLTQSTIKGYNDDGGYNSITESFSLANHARQETISFKYNSNLEEKFRFFSTLYFTNNWNNKKNNNNFGILSGFKINF